MAIWRRNLGIFCQIFIKENHNVLFLINSAKSFLKIATIGRKISQNCPIRRYFFTHQNMIRITEMLGYDVIVDMSRYDYCYKDRVYLYFFLQTSILKHVKSMWLQQHYRFGPV